MLRRPSGLWLAEGNQRLYAKATGAGPAPKLKPQPEPLNVQPTLELGGSMELTFRGVSYIVPPVPFKAGIELSALWTRLENLDGKDPGELAEILTRLVKLFRTLVRPRGMLRRLFWRFTRNPFASASPREVGQLVGFFSVCRALSGVSLSSKEGASIL